jgi:hypothetical protein
MALASGVVVPIPTLSWALAFFGNASDRKAVIVTNPADLSSFFIIYEVYPLQR